MDTNIEVKKKKGMVRANNETGSFCLMPAPIFFSLTPSKPSTHNTRLPPLHVVFIPLPAIVCAHLFAMDVGYKLCVTALSFPTDARTLHVHKMAVSSLLVRNKTFINGPMNGSKDECITDVKNKD
jgi:hypothetical protein